MYKFLRHVNFEDDHQPSKIHRFRAQQHTSQTSTCLRLIFQTRDMYITIHIGA